MDEGIKHDAGKPRVGLVMGDFSRALIAVAEVGTFGAAKYSDHNWINVPNGIERYTDALWRHLLEEGVDDGPGGSGLSHAAHTAWNALARLELMLRSGEQHLPP